MDYGALNQRYQDEFDPSAFTELSRSLAFLRYFYQRKQLEILETGVLKGSTLIDFGCGPTVYNVLPFTKRFDHVVLCDYVPQNLKEVEKWMKGDPDALDWSFLEESLARLEGYSDIAAGMQEIRHRTRKAIKHVVPCDALDLSVLPKEQRVEYDVLLTNLCLEVAAHDLNTFDVAVSNMARLIKPGGHVVQCGILETRRYVVGNAEFPVMNLTEDIVKSALEKAGFKILLCETDETIEIESYKVKHGGGFVVLAVKM